MSYNHTNAHTRVQIQNPKPALDRASIITRQARRWAKYASNQMPERPGWAYEKALESIEFTLKSGARSFAVASKLYGVRERQEALKTLLEVAPASVRALEVEPVGGDLIVSYAGMLLGALYRTHARWVRPLMEHGATVHLLAVTGDPERTLLGTNIAIGNVFPALDLYHKEEERRTARPTGDGDGQALGATIHAVSVASTS